MIDPDTKPDTRAVGAEEEESRRDQPGRGAEARSYAQALRKIAPALWMAALFSAAVNLLMLTGPFYMLQVYDRVLSSGSIPTLQSLFGIVVVLYVFLGVYIFLRSRLLSRAAYRLQLALGAPSLRLGMDAGAGDPSAASGNLATVRGFLASPAMASLFDVPWIPLFLAVVFLIHPWLGIMTTLGALVVLALAVLGQLAGRRALAESAQLDAEQSAFRRTLWRDTEPLRAMGMATAAERRWARLQNAALSAMQTAGERGEVVSAISRSFRLLLQSALLTLGAFLAIRQEISPGMIIAASIIAGRALAPVDQVIGAWSAMGRALSAHRALREAFPERLDAVADTVGEGKIALPAPNGPLVLTEVTCLSGRISQITGEEGRLLDGIDFTLAPGDALGVVGASAAGKTTLARVVTGVLAPSSGEVRLDGARLDQWQPEALGRHIGYLPQKVEMMPGTVAENISRFREGASDDDVVAAARLAGVHEMILALPGGYATRIGDDDRGLSGGQTQRLGLARAVFGGPTLVVLDEPNSNLDASGDDALLGSIDALRARGSIVIVMAHRPSVLRAMSHVLVLQSGRAVRFGPAAEVLAPSSGQGQGPGGSKTPLRGVPS